MSNTLITSSIILNEMIMELKNNLTLAEKIDRQYSNQFGNSQPLKRGDTVNVRRRVNFLATNSYATDGDMTGNVSDIVEGSVPIRMTDQPSVVFEVSSQDLTLDISDFSERYIRPAAIEIAQYVDSKIAEEGQKFPWLEGTPGTPFTTFVEVARVDAVLDNYGVPNDGMRCFFITPNQMIQLANVLTTNFVTDLARRAIERALVTQFAGLEIYKNQSLKTHTVGEWGAGPITVNGAAQETTYALVKDTDYLSQTLNMTGFGLTVTGVLNVGDSFTIDGVYQVNHRTRESTGELQRFGVIAAADSDGAGDAAVTITPAIITSGAYQTVFIAGGTLADATAVTIVSGAETTMHRHNLAFHRDAITLATADLEPYMGNVDNSTGAMDGIAMRVAMDSDILRDKNTVRVDMLFGVHIMEVRAGLRSTE